MNLDISMRIYKFHGFDKMAISLGFRFVFYVLFALCIMIKVFFF